MKDKPLAPEVLPRCPVCDKRVLCINDRQLERHVDYCFKKLCNNKNVKIAYQ